MLKARIEARDLKEVVNTLLALVDEANFEVTREGIRTRAMDVSRIAMIMLELPPSAFQDFDFAEEKAELGINLDKVKEVLKGARASDIIEISVPDPTMIEFAVGNVKRRIRLLGAGEVKTPKAPVFEFTAKAELFREEFMKFLNYADDISDHIVIEMKPGQLRLYASGEGEMEEVELTLTEDQLPYIDVQEEARAMYTIEYIMAIMKAASSADRVTLKIKTDHPMEMEFTVCRGAGTARFLLAPRISAE